MTGLDGFECPVCDEKADVRVYNEDGDIARSEYPSDDWEYCATVVDDRPALFIHVPEGYFE